jgi:hypothetical protein
LNESIRYKGTRIGRIRRIFKDFYNTTVQFSFETGKIPVKRILWLAALAKREEGGSDF